MLLLTKSNEQVAAVRFSISFTEFVFLLILTILPSNGQSLIKNLPGPRVFKAVTGGIIPGVGGGGGIIPGVGGGGGIIPGVGGGNLPSCNIQLPKLPDAGEIAKLITIPAKEIVDQAVKLEAAPFAALGDAIAEKLRAEVDKKIDETRDWVWAKVTPILFVVAILAAILASIIVGVPIKALLYRVPIPK
jgi:hypothetical protein